MNNANTVWYESQPHVPRHRFNDFRRAYFTSTAATAAGAGAGGAALGAGASLATIGVLAEKGAAHNTANYLVQNLQNKFYTDVLKPAAVLAQTDPEGAQAMVEKAWPEFLASANKFAAGASGTGYPFTNNSKVVKQMLLQTPSFTSTVGSLLGKNPLDSSYTAGLPILQNILQGGGPGLGPATNPTTGGTPVPTDNPNDPQGDINNGPTAGGVPVSSIDPFGDPGLDTSSSTDTGPIYGPAWPGAPNGIPSSTAPTTALGKIIGILTGNSGGTNSSSTTSLLQRLLPTLISSGTSLAGGILGANAANNAATIQANAATKAAQLAYQTGQDSLAFNKQVLAQQQSNIQPWINAGTGALTKISDMISQPGFSWNQTFTPPNPQDVLKNPAIQFQLDEGAKELSRTAAGKGRLYSGGTLKGIDAYGQGVAAQGYGDLFNRDLSTYNTNYNTFANERSAALNPLLSVAGLGQTSTGSLNSNLSTASNLNADIAGNTAGAVNNLATSAAAARAAGGVGAANAYGGALSSIGNNLMSSQSIAQIIALLQGQGAGKAG